MATARRRARARLARGGMRRLLIICYGNIYRSAFVARIPAPRFDQRLEVRSGGFHKVEGRASPDAHVKMSAEFGVDLTAHRSRRVSTEDVEWADTVVLMDRHNWASLDSLGVDPGKCVWLALSLRVRWRSSTLTR